IEKQRLFHSQCPHENKPARARLCCRKGVAAVTAFPTAISGICCHCGKSGGGFERVTYLGAPEGGVPVHHGKCLAKFFDRFYSPFSAEAIELRRREWNGER